MRGTSRESKQNCLPVNSGDCFLRVREALAPTKHTETLRGEAPAQGIQTGGAAPFCGGSKGGEAPFVLRGEAPAQGVATGGEAPLAEGAKRPS